MAKKNNKQDIQFGDNEENKKGSKVVSALIIFMIVLIWLAIFAALIKLDLGGFGSQVLRPVLKNVPVINRILPAASDETLAGENNYSYRNLTEASAVIKELQSKLKASTDENTANQTTVSDLQAEVNRLKKFEENQTAFEKQKLEFDKNVVFNEKAPELQQYKTYYESINPQNAETIYRQVVEQLQYDEKVKKQADIFSKMEPAKAAAKLEVMTGDLDLIAGILSSMSTAKSALILENMTDEMAAQVTKKMTMANK